MRESSSSTRPSDDVAARQVDLHEERDDGDDAEEAQRRVGDLLVLRRPGADDAVVARAVDGEHEQPREDQHDGDHRVGHGHAARVAAEVDRAGRRAEPQELHAEGREDDDDRVAQRQAPGVDDPPA
nr:hypothetical protein [Clavibacter phaseoli]